jgi:hypothetical protein
LDQICAELKLGRGSNMPGIGRASLYPAPAHF